MVTVNNSDYYNNIPAGRDLNKLPNTSSAGTTVGYLRLHIILRLREIQ